MPAASGPAASTPPVDERQVLVVGGSVEGLAAAAFLRRAGLSPVVVTTGEYPQRDGDVVLWSAAASLLAEVGGVDDLLASAVTVHEWHLRLSTDETERLTSPRDDSDRLPFLAADRVALRRLLRKRLSAGDVRLSKTPTRLEPTDSGVLVEFADGVRERFDVVVGGEGAHSWVRRSRFDADGPTPWGTTTWTVRSPGRVGRPGTVSERWTPDETVTCGPRSAPGRIQFVTSEVDVSDPDAAARRLSSVADVGPVAEVSPSELTVVDGGPDYRVRSERWAAGRVALLGPAARPLPPTRSLTPSLSVEDAYVLTDELASAASSATALERYARRRQERHRVLDELLPHGSPPLRDCTASDGQGLRSLHRVRAAVLRSVFARDGPGDPSDVSTSP
jgi:2-polyprenyl-6-methoxyphenol hydroxylase-like FAD-dependent oxidoreductase